MSDNTSNTDNSNTQNPQQQGKGREPSHDVYQVNGQGKNAQWHKIGAVWQGKDDTLSGDTVHGRLVLKSRLNDMRTEKAAQQEQGQQQALNQSKDPSQNPSM